MLDLIAYSDGKVVIGPEVVFHEPFNYLIERDKTEGKVRAHRDLSYIFLMHDPRSSFFAYPEPIRSEKVQQAVYGKPTNIDKKIRQAIDYYIDLQLKSSQSYNFFLASKEAADRLAQVMRTVDWTLPDDERNFTIKEFQAFLKDSEPMLASLNALEKKAREELFSKQKVKANRTINPLEE